MYYLAYSNIQFSSFSDLTWSNLRDFHKFHYSADNARFYTYGNLQLEEHLKFISEYLPKEPRNEAYAKGNLNIE